MLAGLDWQEGAAARPGHFPAHPLDLLALQRRDQIAPQQEGAVGLAPGVAGLGEPLGASFEGLRHLPAETGRSDRNAAVGDQLPVEPGRPVAADLLSRPSVERMRTRRPSPPRLRS